jgi:hypothetical protein
MAFNDQANWPPSAEARRKLLSSSQIWLLASGGFFGTWIATYWLVYGSDLVRGAAWNAFAVAIALPAALAGLFSRRERFASAAIAFGGSGLALMSMFAVVMFMLASWSG